MRGHNPILYDLRIIFGVDPPDPTRGQPSYESLEDARLALGDTRALAERIALRDMSPAGDLSSSGYALASVGKEYVVLRATPLLRGGDLIADPDLTGSDCSGRSRLRRRESRSALVQ